MEAASERARQGDVNFFSALATEDLARLATRKDEDGRSLLHTAAASGSAAIVELLVQAGAKSVINDTDDEGWTPLQSAVSSGRGEVVPLLLSLGADVSAANSGGRTAAHYAASKGNAVMLHLLKGANADFRKTDSTGSTPLHRAAATGKEEAVKVLVEEGKVPVNPQDKEGNTPLHLAIMCHHSNAALYLAAHGADLKAVNKEEQTPLQIAGNLRPALMEAAGLDADMADAA